MALTFTIRSRMAVGNLKFIAVEMTPDDSYPTGGWDAPISSLTDGYIVEPVTSMGSVGHLSGYPYVWDGDNEKLIVFYASGVAAHTHTTTVAAGTFDTGEEIGFDGAAVVATSGGTLTSNANTAILGAATEVANATDLSNTGVVTMWFLGR